MVNSTLGLDSEVAGFYELATKLNIPSLAVRGIKYIMQNGHIIELDNTKGVEGAANSVVKIIDSLISNKIKPDTGEAVVRYSQKTI